MSITAQQLLNSKQDKTIFSVSPDQSTYEALQLMAAKNIGAVAVIEEGHLIGLLTEREYARKIVLHGKASRHTPVFDTMKRDFPRVSPETTIEECMKLITDLHSRYVAVMEDGAFLGLISTGDILKHIIVSQQENIEHLKRYIRGL